MGESNAGCGLGWRSEVGAGSPVGRRSPPYEGKPDVTRDGDAPRASGAGFDLDDDVAELSPEFVQLLTASARHSTVAAVLLATDTACAPCTCAPNGELPADKPMGSVHGS
jgi:hypothetical protein